MFLGKNNLSVLEGILWNILTLLDGNWGSNWNIMNDPADSDLWLDLSVLWGDLSVNTSWSKNLLLGYKWSEVTSLSGSDSGNWDSVGLNDMGLDSNGLGDS